MRTEALTRARIGVVLVFALSCFGILLYLWDTFGGAVPLKPQGYRIVVPVPESDLLTAQADVRVSGVSVGHVVRTSRRPSTVTPNTKDITLQIDTPYAPLHGTVKAIIRRKSIGGEMYLELTPGDRTARAIPDGGRLPAADVAPSVELDEVFRAFDARTKRALGQWLQQQALSINGRGRDLSDAFGNAAAFEEDATTLLQLLNEQQGAVRRAVSNTGAVFDALSRRGDALQGLIVNGRRATQAFADQHQAFADTWKALPTFELESRKLLARANSFAKNADPVVQAFRPAWRELGPTARALAPTAKEFVGFFGGVQGLESASVRGLPATRRFLTELRPFVREWSPFLAQLIPVLQHFQQYLGAVTTFFANTTAITNATAGSYGSDKLRHYAKATVVFSPEDLAQYAHRLPTNRANPYAPPGAAITPTSPLPVFDNTACGPAVFPKLGPDPNNLVPGDLADRIRKYVLNDDQPVAAPCLLQSKPGGAYTQLQALSPNRGGPRTP